ncbi:hypothetical protein ACFSTC_20585 [Nonomuraea ferruginea]
MTSAQRDPRTAALRRFALSITVFNLLGHLWLGFEQAYITPIVAVAFAYALDLALETAEASAEKRTPKYRKEGLLDFLLPAHISGLACAMLLYANDRLWPVLFAVAVAIGGKYIVRVRVAGKKRHILNPSNSRHRDHPAGVPLGRHRAAIPLHRVGQRSDRLDHPRLHPRRRDHAQRQAHGEDAAHPGLGRGVPRPGRDPHVGRRHRDDERAGGHDGRRLHPVHQLHDHRSRDDTGQAA